MIDLSTDYLGFKLRNPLVASAGPLCRDVDNIRRMVDAGLAAVVLHSLFEEQIDAESSHLDRMLSSGVETAEAQTYFPELTHYNMGPDGYLEHIRKVKRTVPVPLIASLNGVSAGGWVRYARLMQHAGADALELNLYDVPCDPLLPGAALEDRYVAIVSEIRSQLTIPLAVKIGPYFTSIPNITARLAEAGAGAVVIFNRFYQPDYELETLDLVPSLQLSTPQELLLRLHWTAILFGRLNADIAVTGGVHSAVDIVKCMLAGARVAMTTSALLRHGIGHAGRLLEDLRDWLEQHEYESVRQMQGAMSARRVSDRNAFERANYMKVLGSYTLAGA
ncbi:MAG TPA: dihydroorotate dehydrogenase-like protein [Bryobacteraceae bacterium]|jgi:dihydroorotate dehydrogenase (fumarate)|nr:dihydroorotate dehydrogenase-like protein [Bryobacteraceae bacterium]